MKKVFRKLSFLMIICLLCFFLIKSFNNNTATSNAQSSSIYHTIKVYNGNHNAGSISLKILEEDKTTKEQTVKKTYEEDLATHTIVAKNIMYGTKYLVEYDLNEGYDIYNWASTNEQTYTTIKNASGDAYLGTSLKSTVDKDDVGVYIGAKAPSEHVVTFYETSSTSLSNIIGYSFVEDGKKADTSFVFIPQRTGFNYKGFFDSIDNVKGDITTYPTYYSNIFTIFRDYKGLFFKGLLVTLLLAVISILLSMILGASLCLGKLSDLKAVRLICSAYVEVIRGVPSLLQLLLIYCFIGPTKIHIGSFFSTEVLSCIIALFINSSAYTAEIFRSGIQAVDAGQMEAGRALGLSKWQVMKKIILPQGIKNSLPSLGNELVMIIKETSLAYSVNNAIGELMCAKVKVTSVTGNSIAPYLIIAIIYFIVTFSLSRLIIYLEKRFA